MAVNVWLDDLDHEQRPIPEGWLHVRTIDEAKEVLQSHNVQQLSLDHDLGACPDCTKAAMRCQTCYSRGRADFIRAKLEKSGQFIAFWMCKDCGGVCWEDWDGMMANCSHFGTGYDLCLWMAEHGIWPAEKPTVHSMNPVGRKRMQGVIDRYFVPCPERDNRG